MSLQFKAVSDDGLWLDHTWPVGLHCLLGNPGDGPQRALELASGQIAPRAGKVTLDGKATHSSARVRASMGSALDQSRTLGAGSALDQLKLWSELHASVTACLPPQQCLGQLGLEALAQRPLHSLSPAEQRALSLCLALGLEQPRALLLADPFGVPGVERQLLAQLLNERAQRCVVLVATAQRSDCLTLNCKASLFFQGRLVQSPLDLRHTQSGNARLRVTSRSAAEFAVALLKSPHVRQVHAPLHAGTLEVTGTDPRELSLAILRIAAETQLPLDNLVEAPIDLDGLHAVTRGQLDGAYAAAYQAAYHARAVYPAAYPAGAQGAWFQGNAPQPHGAWPQFPPQAAAQPYAPWQQGATSGHNTWTEGAPQASPAAALPQTVPPLPALPQSTTPPSDAAFNGTSFTPAAAYQGQIDSTGLPMPPSSLSPVSLPSANQPPSQAEPQLPLPPGVKGPHE